MKTIPTFETEQQEREFWENNDSTEFIDWKNAKNLKFTNLKKSTKTISLRLPEDMLEKLRIKANAMDVPYQSFIKMIIQKNLSKKVSRKCKILTFFKKFNKKRRKSEIFR